ncbi:MAG: methyltransferase domain-containing protein [Proteobacteria bacterium]|nr:methyltransferase domain-containing protein [Pseudomonadota bacterium]
MKEKLFNPENAARLDDPVRLGFLPFADVLDEMEILPGMTVIDIGVGTGYFAIPIARMVGETGTVYAVDVQTAMLEYLEKKIVHESLSSIFEIIEAPAEDTSLPGECAHIILMANLWHEIDDHMATLEEAGRLLKPNGRLFILDWRPDVERPPGPAIEHRISANQVVAFLAANGWQIGLNKNIGTYSYLLSAFPDIQSI